MAEKRHKLLERQLRSIAGVVSKLSKDDCVLFEAFLKEVEDAYRSSEEDKELLEHSMELSSSELFNANKEMREKNQRLLELQGVAERLRHERELILNSVGEGICRLDANGHTTFLNPFACVMLGWEASEIIGKNQHSLIQYKRYDGSPYPNEESPIHASLRDGEIHRIDSEVFWRKDGSSFPVEYTTTPIYENEQIVGAVVVFKDVTRRKKIEAELRDIAHQAGMAEIATGILHNVGNILNSVNVGVETMHRTLESSEILNLKRANDLLKENLPNIGQFLSTHSKGKLLPQYYLHVGDALETEFSIMRKEIKDLQGRIDLIKNVINSQQTHAKGGGFKEEIYLPEVLESALALQSTSLTRHEIHVVKKFNPVDLIVGQKTKLVHVLLNLMKNAKEAMAKAQNYGKELTLEIGNTKENVYINLKDNGEGIPQENLTRIFNHGFTTKANGHGFGLHYCANAITEMGGRLTVESEGPGKGTTFTILLPKKNLMKEAS